MTPVEGGSIALVGEYYETYLKAFRKAHASELAPLGYERHLETLLTDHFGVFGGYRNHLRRQGQSAELFVPNDFALQQKWLNERPSLRLKANESTKLEVLLKQLVEMRPWAVFVASMFDYYGEFLNQVAKHVTPNIFTWIACPYPSKLDFGSVRCVVSSVPVFVEEFRRHGVQSERLDAAFDSDVLKSVGDVPRSHPLTFVGSLGRSIHSFRWRSLQRLARSSSNLEVWGTGLARSRRQRLSRLLRLPDSPLLKSSMERAYRGEAWGKGMYEIFASSRATLNFHIDVAKEADFVGNMRLFEATGMGTAVLTDTGPGMKRLFQDDEIVTYTSEAELHRKARMLVNEPSMALEIGQRGQRACVERHSYAVRIEELRRILYKHAA